jgi:hypothetical protein
MAGDRNLVHRLVLVTTALFPLATAVQAQPYYSPSGIVGGILGVIQQQQQMQQQQQLEQQQRQQLQQQQLQQQQIEADRQRAAAQAQSEVTRQQADAQEKARQRQQAEVAKTRQEQAAAARAAKAQADATAADEKRRLEAANKLRADPVFAPIIGHDSRDITLLIVGRDTPNVVRNLKGEPVFQKSATACLPFGGISADPNTVEARFLIDIQKQVERKGGLVSSSLLLTTCDPAKFADYDLIVFSRAQIGNGTVEVLAPLVDALRRRIFVPLATYGISDFVAAETAKAEAAHAETTRIEAERMDALRSFQTRDASVVSVIHVTAPAAVVCIASNPDPDGVRYLLKRPDSPFGKTVTPDSVIREFPSSDAIFIALKRGECTAAAAPAGMLEEVMGGLIRDNFKVEVDKGLISAGQLAAWKTLSAEDLAKAQEQQARDLAERRQQDAQRQAKETERRTLDAQRTQNDEAARRDELERMRQQVISKATAVMEDLTRRVQRHIASVVSEVNDTKQRVKAGRVLSRQEQADRQTMYEIDRLDFHPWSEEIATMMKEGWEFSEPHPTIEDYGRAQWKQRTIEAITVRMEFPVASRVIGEKKVICEDFTWINDEEFQFMRQPQTVPCDEYRRSFDAWSQANGFVSQWNLLQPVRPRS